jgi:hypothetical protein
MGSSNNTHTFCFRCVVEITGDGSRVLENLLFLANHITKARSNGTWSRDKHCRSKGYVTIVAIKQTSPCHPEFFLNYNSNSMTATLRTDPKICAGHMGGPRVLPMRVRHLDWHLCNNCFSRLSRAKKIRWGVCDVCTKHQTKGGPICKDCKQRFENFVYQRTPAALALLSSKEK